MTTKPLDINSALADPTLVCHLDLGKISCYPRAQFVDETLPGFGLSDDCPLPDREAVMEHWRSLIIAHIDSAHAIGLVPMVAIGSGVTLLLHSRAQLRVFFTGAKSVEPAREPLN